MRAEPFGTAQPGWSAMQDVVIIEDLRKSFASTEVLKGINLSFRRGEVHAFLGANGAGKSTLLGCLSGAIRPSSGRIKINGATHASLTPRQSRELGIGIIYQHFQVIEGLTVADNIFLGDEILRWGTVNARHQNRIANDLLERLGVLIDPRRLLDELSIGQRQLVEIARALLRKPDILILDEPTAALSEHEMSALHQVVRQLATEENLAIVYVTHLIDEVEQIADRVSVLRDGNIIWSRPVAQASHDELARAIAPNLSRNEGPRRNSNIRGEVLLELSDYRTDHTGPVDLRLHAGEVVGLYGLLGSGRTDLLESLVGVRGLLGGDIMIGGQRVKSSSPRDALSHGMALVASDRTEQGLFGELSALDNILMPHFGAYAGNRQRQGELFSDSARRLHLRPNSPALAGARFSGGNAQKLMLGRWLFPDLGVRILLLDEPSQGVDIGAREELYRLLDEFRAAGGAILAASSDPEEIVTLADRVLILHQGVQLAVLDHDITEERLVQLAHKSGSSFGRQGREQTNSAFGKVRI